MWGAAYRIEASKVREVQDYLDIREINGYSMQHTPFWPADKKVPSFKCLVYIGLPDNPQFLGRQDPQAVAEHICRSRGPSGENVEYLLMLEQALKDLGNASGDGHVQDLADRVRRIQSPQAGQALTLTDNAVEAEIEKVKSGNTDQTQEEVED